MRTRLRTQAEPLTGSPVRGLGVALIAVVAMTSGCEALVPEGAVENPRCLVKVVNHLLPVEHGAEPEEVELEPPYVAEMGWRYGGADRRPLADVRVSAPNWEGETVHWELTDPTGRVHSGSVDNDEFRRGMFGISLSIVGTWRYDLRAVDGGSCERAITIDVVPDSQKRAIDP